MKTLKLHILILAVFTGLKFVNAQPVNDPAWNLQTSKSDEFNSGSVNTSYWYNTYPWGNYSGGAEKDIDTNLTFHYSGAGDTLLVIVCDTMKDTSIIHNKAWDVTPPYYWTTYVYQGGIMQTRPAKIDTDQYKFGYFEISAKYPVSGYFAHWPAFWLWEAHTIAGVSWYNEIDIAEDAPPDSYYGTSMGTNIHICAHCDSTNSNEQNFGQDINLGFNVSAGFHKYAVEWEPTWITWYIDDIPVRTYTDLTDTTIPQNPMAVILSMGVSPYYAFLPANWNNPARFPYGHGNAVPTKYPIDFTINYFRYYTLNTSCTHALTICTPSTDYSTRAVESTIEVGGSCSPTFNTSDKYTLRAVSTITLDKGTTINSNGSGSFTIETLPCPQ